MTPVLGVRAVVKDTLNLDFNTIVISVGVASSPAAFSPSIIHIIICDRWAYM